MKALASKLSGSAAVRPGWQKLTAFSDLAALASDWDGLAESHEPAVFSGFAFAEVWWQHWGQAHSLHVFCLGDSEGRLKAIVPFCAEKKNPFLWRALGYTGSDYANSFWSGEESGLAEFLNQEKGWTEIVLHHLPPDRKLMFPTLVDERNSPQVVLRHLAKSRFPVAFREISKTHPFMDRQAILRDAGLIDQKRNRQYLRWFERLGPVEYRSESDPKNIQELLPEFLKLHISKFRSKGEQSWFADPAAASFPEALLKALPPGVVRMKTLRAGGKLVAAHFGFETKKRVCWYLPCYDPELSSRSPGRLLLAFAIREAAENGIEVFDFLVGTEAYKLQHASAVRETAAIRVFRNRISLAKHLALRLVQSLHG